MPISLGYKNPGIVCEKNFYDTIIINTLSDDENDQNKGMYDFFENDSNAKCRYH